MLAAMEDLLDSWPGTLIVVSHDRYLLERVTDQQYAVWHGGLRHLPGGVEEYLALRKREEAGGSGASSTSAASSPVSVTAPAPAASQASPPSLSGAERRAAEKELASIERRMGKLEGEIAAIDERLAEHDQADFDGLTALSQERTAATDEQATLEDRWLELSEQLG